MPTATLAFLTRGSGHRLAQCRFIALALFAPLGGLLLLVPKALHRTAERLGLDALLAPLRTPCLILGPCHTEPLRVLAQHVGQSVEKRAIVLHAHGIHRARQRRSAYVFFAVVLELFVLPFQFDDAPLGVGHRAAQFLRGIGDDFLDRLESL